MVAAVNAISSDVRIPSIMPDEDVPAQSGLEPEPVLAGNPPAEAHRHSVLVQRLLELILRSDAVQPFDERRGKGDHQQHGRG